MTKHPTRSIDEDSKTRIGDYWSKTQDIDIADPARFQCIVLAVGKW
jgi:hypothetical protein